MKRSVLLLLVFIATDALAQSKPPSIPKQYLPFQGQWRVVSEEDDKTKLTDVPEIVVTVTGQEFEFSGSEVSKEMKKLFPLEFRVPATKSENPYRYLKKRGAKKLDDIVDVENQISVFWFVGIFKQSDDELQLALMYCGQGLEGEHFKNFRPPSSFDQKPMEGEARVTLKRVKK